MDLLPEHVLIFIVVITVALIVIDVILDLDKVEGNTYSEVIRSGYRKWSPVGFLIVFAFGLLAGHWFWALLGVVPAGVLREWTVLLPG